MNKSCHYVRFHSPVPPAVNKEPVSEFVLSGKQEKYLVDDMTYTTDGLIFKAYGEIGIIPLANVVYCRFTKEEQVTIAPRKLDSIKPKK